MVYVFLADGFEEVEAVAPIDVLRRGGVDVITVGVGQKCVTGTHGISVNCDITIDNASFCGLQGIILPGGMPGTVNLEKCDKVQEFIDYCIKENLIIGAICAAPSILGHKGLLRGKKAVCFNGFEKELAGADVLELPCVTDGNIVTAWGAGAGIDFGFEYLTAITGDKDFSDKLCKSMRYVRGI